MSKIDAGTALMKMEAALGKVESVAFQAAVVLPGASEGDDGYEMNQILDEIRRLHTRLVVRTMYGHWCQHEERT